MKRKIKKILNNLYQHLITRKKYNTLKLKYDVLKEDLENKVTELNVERRKHLKMKEIWEKKLKEQEEEIIRLKKRRKKNGN